MSNLGAATVAAGEGEKVSGEAEMESATAAAAAVSEWTVKRKKRRRKQELANAKENGVVEQEAASVAAGVLEGTVKCKKKRKKKQVVENVKENVVEQEAASFAAAVLEGTVKCKKKRKKKQVVANVKENVVEQEAASVVAAVLEGTVKHKKTRSKKEAVDAKENGTVEQEAASVAASVHVSEGMPKPKESKAKERVMTEQEATTTSVSALDETPKCKEEKEKQRGVVEHGTTTSAISEGTKKHKKKLKKKNKIQKQQESAQALSGLVVVDKLVASKPENGGTNGEGTSGDADVMDPINVEDPNCSKAKDANDKVNCKAQEGNTNCSEKFSSLHEGSEDRKRQRKRQKRKRRRDARSRSPDISSHKVKDIYSPRGSLIRFQRKKLLILDLNGLLADINMDNQNAHMAHAKVKGKLVFIRPYYDDFLRFCFQNFELGIWSSRKMENVKSVVDILMPDLKQYLLFCWDQSKCTSTGCKVIGDKHKPLVLKYLKRLWYKEDPNLPWELGDFSPSNTLLVDDSPYKALCNPPHTAIFPQPYSYLNQRDDYSLAPGGDLRVYLERLAAADDVQDFVRDNPFGQPSITESDPNWDFYLEILKKVEHTIH